MYTLAANKVNQNLHLLVTDRRQFNSERRGRDKRLGPCRRREDRRVKARPYPGLSLIGPNRLPTQLSRVA